MIRSKKCPKCEDSRIAGPHNVWGGDAHIKIDLPGLYTATLVAFTCTNCGYTELYSDSAGLTNLRRDGRFLAYQQQSTQIHCARCGARLRPGEGICYECGAQVE
jgi:predicted nucleic-acid-binding Zn-ribbon protein